MLYLTKKISVAKDIDDQLVLPFNLRQKSRLRVTLVSGKEAGLFLERGQILRNGTLLQAENGQIVQVIAADEPVMDVTASSHFDLMRGAYHLGNRHVPLQISAEYLRLEQDSVLKGMLLGLGLVVNETNAPFEPESGAYGEHRHSHGHGLQMMKKVQHG